MRGYKAPKGNALVSFHIVTCKVIEISQVIKQWCLQPASEFKLKREAANFYLLYDLSIDFPGFKLKVNEKAAFLAKQFSNYILMAIGGEIRHAKDKILIDEEDTPWYEAGDTERAIYEAIRSMKHGGHYGRSEFWLSWKQLYKKHGLPLIETARSLFTDYEWDGSYGGASWGKICDVVLRWLRKEDNDIIFVDTCWGLHHNGDIVFDKLWSIEGLQRILDANLDGHMDDLLPHASLEVRDLWIKYDAQRKETEQNV